MLFLIGGGILFLGILTFNIFKGSFNILKFVNGFNLFAPGVQGKLIYYGIVFAIVAAVALGIYHRFTQETYENTYKNQIHHNSIVTVDQRQIVNGEDDLFFGVKLFGFKLGLCHKGKIKGREIINNKEVKKPITLWDKIKRNK